MSKLFSNLRRKPVGKEPEYADWGSEESWTPTPYFENVAKDVFPVGSSEQATTKSTGISMTSLTTAYATQSVSDSHSEVKPKQLYGTQEHSHARSLSSDISLESETAATSSSRALGATPRPTTQRYMTFTPESSESELPQILRTSEEPYYNSNQESSTSQRDTNTETSELVHGVRIPEASTSQVESSDTVTTRPINSQQRQRDKINHSGELGYAVSGNLPLADYEEDDLSDCSDDSFVEEQRLKYYMENVTESVHSESWLKAKESFLKFMDILLDHNNKMGTTEIEGNVHFLNATIHYMLGELEVAKSVLAKMPKKRSTEPLVLVTIFNLQAAVMFRTMEYEEALSLAKKGARYARKSALREEENEAHYLSHLICNAKGDPSESTFHKQMVPGDYKPPRYIEILESEQNGLVRRLSQEAPHTSMPKHQSILSEPNQSTFFRASISSLSLPPRTGKVITESVFTDSGLRLYKQLWPAEGSHPEYSGSAPAWKKAIKTVIDADADSESALYLYGTYYINDQSEQLSTSDDSLVNRPNYPILYAIAHQRLYALKAMISARRVKVDIPSAPKTPLQLAVELNPISVALLLQAGASARGIGFTVRETPLCIAVAIDSLDSVKCLLEYGAHPLEDSDSHSNVALRIAITKSVLSSDIIESLLDALRSREDYEKLRDLEVEMKDYKQVTGNLLLAPQSAKPALEYLRTKLLLMESALFTQSIMS